jgi:hypothetical protein
MGRQEMHMSAIEILAALLIALSVVKLLFLVTNMRAWLLLVKRLHSSPKVTSLVALALAGVVLYLLVQSGLTIVQILAVCLFFALLFVAGLAPFSSQVMNWLEGKDLTRILKEQWLYIAVWFLLLGWGIYELAVKG